MRIVRSSRPLRLALAAVLAGVALPVAASTLRSPQPAAEVGSSALTVDTAAAQVPEGRQVMTAAAPSLPERSDGRSALDPVPKLLDGPVTPDAGSGDGAAEVRDFGPVVVERPRLRVTAAPSADTVRQVRGIDGVRMATAIRVGSLPVGRRQARVKVAAVTPGEFRRLVPQLTADEVGVWQRLSEGDAALTHDAGARLRAQLGSTIPAGATGAPLRVGAYASNGVPPVAEAVVSNRTARALGLEGRRDILVALDSGADPDAVAGLVRAATGAEVKVLEQPQTRRAFLTGADARNAFEPYTYVDLGDGMIQIDGDWVSRNIVTREVPLLNGAVRCHRLMIDQLAGALGELEAMGLGSLIDPSQYGGCWVPRHIDFNPSKPLSMHSWGLAVDFNVSTNGLGRTPQLDPRVVEVFDRWGFVWGGRWSRPDGMHFELGALLDSPQG